MKTIAKIIATAAAFSAGTAFAAVPGTLTSACCALAACCGLGCC